MHIRVNLWKYVVCSLVIKYVYFLLMCYSNRRKVLVRIGNSNLEHGQFVTHARIRSYINLSLNSNGLKILPSYNNIYR